MTSCDVTVRSSSIKKSAACSVANEARRTHSSLDRGELHTASRRPKKQTSHDPDRRNYRPPGPLRAVRYSSLSEINSFIFLLSTHAPLHRMPICRISLAHASNGSIEDGVRNNFM